MLILSLSVKKNLNKEESSECEKYPKDLNENISTGSSELKDLNNDQNDNQRFCLRKRRNINYNMKTKKFEYESGSDSDYEDKPKRNSRRY